MPEIHAYFHIAKHQFSEHEIISWTNMKGDLGIPPFRPRSLDYLQCIALKPNSDPCAGKIGAACSAWATRLIWRLGPDSLPRGGLETIMRLLVCNRHDENTLVRQRDDLIKIYAPQIEAYTAADAPHSSPQGRPCGRNSRQDFRRKLGQVIKDGQFDAGYLYIYTCPYIPGFVKVGCSKDEPSRRIKEWTGCYPLATEQYRCGIEFPQRMEELVHLRLATLRSEIICLAPRCKTNYHDEWFECSVEDAKGIIGHLKALNDKDALYDRESRTLSSYWNGNIVGLENHIMGNSGRCTCDAELSGMLQDFTQVRIGAEAGDITDVLDHSDQETRGCSNVHHGARCEMNRNMEVSES
jgi:hypothetical protein